LSTAGRLAASYARDLPKLLAAIKARGACGNRDASANRMVVPLEYPRLFSELLAEHLFAEFDLDAVWVYSNLSNEEDNFDDLLRDRALTNALIQGGSSRFGVLLPGPTTESVLTSAACGGPAHNRQRASPCSRSWRGLMDAEIRKKILTLLDQHRIMTVAMLRPDGWPQATTVGYVNEGPTLYFLCGIDSQKARNLARDDRISLTIDHDTADLMTITGLSMAGHAHAVDDRAEAEKVLRMLPLKYPDAPPLPMKMPSPDEIRLFRVTPMVMSVLDYSKGFGHTDLVTC